MWWSRLSTKCDSALKNTILLEQNKNFHASKAIVNEASSMYLNLLWISCMYHCFSGPENMVDARKDF